MATLNAERQTTIHRGYFRPCAQGVPAGDRKGEGFLSLLAATGIRMQAALDATLLIEWR
jgi:hypothetical protein